MYYSNFHGRTGVRKAKSIPPRVLVAMLAMLGCVWQPLRAAQHVVSTVELENQLRSAHSSRQAELQKIAGFVRSETYGEILQATKLDASQIETAVAFLSDEEVARLASHIRNYERDVKAGALSNEHLTYIVIALAAAVLVLVLK